MKIREFKTEDVSDLMKILELNDQLSPVEGPEEMKRVGKCEAAVFLVVERENKVVGAVKGVYDGSRALIHLLSIHPKYQGQGIGRALIREIACRFKENGAPSVSVTASTQSKGFFEKLGFKEYNRVIFMLADSIDDVIGST